MRKLLLLFILAASPIFFACSDDADEPQKLPYNEDDTRMVNNLVFEIQDEDGNDLLALDAEHGGIDYNDIKATYKGVSYQAVTVKDSYELPYALVFVTPDDKFWLKEGNYYIGFYHISTWPIGTSEMTLSIDGKQYTIKIENREVPNDKDIRIVQDCSIDGQAMEKIIGGCHKYTIVM